MEVDFSDLVFSSGEDVDYVYDRIENSVSDTNEKWYFLVNYRNTKINPDAWVQFSLRGKKINLASSIGSVRFDPNEPTREEIEKRDKQEGFKPNVVSTRQEALERIGELKIPAKIQTWSASLTGVYSVKY